MGTREDGADPAARRLIAIEPVHGKLGRRIMTNARDRLSRRILLAGSAVIATATAANANKGDRLIDGAVILIDRNDPHVMGHAISYSANLSKHFAEKG